MYIQRSKDECCEKHFWWRIAQCMENEHPLWSSNGVSCELTTNRDQWDVKYTPGTWDTSDLFETLQECCNAKFWWDVKGCKAASPRELMFEFSFDSKALIVPLSCQVSLYIFIHYRPLVFIVGSLIVCSHSAPLD